LLSEILPKEHKSSKLKVFFSTNSLDYLTSIKR